MIGLLVRLVKALVALVKGLFKAKKAPAEVQAEAAVANATTEEQADAPEVATTPAAEEPPTAPPAA